MADQKITQLPALTTPASTDVLAIVDIAANTTKKIEVQNLVSGVSVATQANTRLITATSVNDALQGEAQLTFDGTSLICGGNIEADSITETTTGTGSDGSFGQGATLIELSGSVVSAGYLYANTSTGWSDTSATSVGQVSTGLVAMATTNASGDGMVTRGIVNLAVDPGGQVGDAVYLDTASGQATTTPVSASGNVSRVIGYKVSTKIIYLNPSQDWIEIS
jgi:hypothetical protein